MSHVWRVGNTIHRQAGPWTPQVQRLLAHLHAQGVVGVPEPLGIDATGREVLSYLPGEVGASPLIEAQRNELVLIQAATLLRRIHDATTTVAKQWNSGWRAAVREPIEVICHGDFAPYNCVFIDNQLTGVFDFDFAHAGPRIWDLAYALYRFVPLADANHTEGFGTPAQQAQRLRLFCASYGLHDRAQVVSTVIARIQFMIDMLLEGQARGDERCIANIAAGHLALYQHDRAYVERYRADFEAALATDRA
ncbi:MAG: aminoglycoside phosphotransferase family protein [Roseiflexaceae bacterium]